MALGAAALLMACSDDDGPRPGVTTAEAESSATTVRATPSEFRTGTCLELVGFVPGLQVTKEATTPVPCEQPHRAEVFGSLVHPAAGDVEWPGDIEVAGYAESECLARFEPAIGAPYETSALDFTVLGPTQDSWDDGDRAIVCIAYDTDGVPLTGSVIASGR